MNVRDGYKATEVGVLPEEWNEVTLSELGVWYGGGTPSKANAEYWTNGTIYWVSSQDVKQKYIHTTDNLITERAVKESSAKLTKHDSLIVVMRSGILKHTFPVAIAPFPVAINQDIKVLSPYKGISTEYVYAYLRYRNRDIVSNLVKFGTTVESVEYDQLKKFPIALPPPIEQQRIADILATVDEHISETEALINKTQVLKKGMMQRLLTKGVGHTEFKDTEIGRVPSTWLVKKIDDLGKIRKGRGINRNSIEYVGLPCIRYGEIYTTYNYIVRSVISYISRETAKTSEPIRKGEILITGSGETAEDIGKAVVYDLDEQGFAGGDILILRPDESTISPLFLSYQWETKAVLSQRKKSGQGASIFHLYSEALKKIQIALPSLPEQRKIASILSTIDDQIDVYQSKLTSLTRLKSALMQKLLTGRIRVQVKA